MNRLFSDPDPLPALLAYDREVSQPRNPLFSLMAEMFGRGGVMNPTGPVVEPTREGVMGASQFAADMLNPAPGVDRSIEAFQGGRYVDAFAEGAAAIPMIATATTGRAASRLLPPRNAAERQADDIAAMLREGRADQVTDDMMANADPQRLWRLYDEGATGQTMPMDTPSRMARARDMGFDTGRPVYHGTPDQRRLMESGFDNTPQGQALRNPGEWVDAPRPAFTTDNRAVARTYANDERAWDYQNADPSVLELYRRSSNDAVIDAQGARFRGLYGDDVADATGANLSQYRGQVMDNEVSTDGLGMILRDQGFDGARIRNVVDDYMGHGRPAEVQMTLDPRNLRLKEARFDPRLSHLRNLNAGIAPIGVGLSGMPYLLQQQAE